MKNNLTVEELIDILKLIPLNYTVSVEGMDSFSVTSDDMNECVLFTKRTQDQDESIKRDVVINSVFLNRKEQRSIATAYMLANRAYNEYRNKVVKLYGEDMDEEVIDEEKMKEICEKYDFICDDSPWLFRISDYLRYQINRGVLDVTDDEIDYLLCWYDDCADIDDVRNGEYCGEQLFGYRGGPCDEIELKRWKEQLYKDLEKYF